MKRAVIIAKGDVQRVGYRDMVERIARKLKLTGFVENLKPYDVKIVAEGEEEILNEFVTQTRIEKHPIVPVSVEEIEVEFGTATGEFEYFEIKRGDPQEELGERMDAAGALLYRSVELGRESVELGRESVELGRESVGLSRESVELSRESVELGRESVGLGKESVSIGNKMLGKQDQMLEKQDEHTNILIEKMDAHTNILTDLRDQTHQNFEILDVKYGSISENMERLIEEIKNERKESRESMKGLTDAILKLAISKK
ncbi:MAG: Acylphosphatase [Candidatus Methanogaster sp.]|nr:MAG: Acylphosphatase [ANME-2 cluster archaeon]